MERTRAKYLPETSGAGESLAAILAGYPAGRNSYR